MPLITGRERRLSRDRFDGGPRARAARRPSGGRERLPGDLAPARRGLLLSREFAPGDRGYSSEHSTRGAPWFSELRLRGKSRHVKVDSCSAFPCEGSGGAPSHLYDEIATFAGVVRAVDEALARTSGGWAHGARGPVCPRAVLSRLGSAAHETRPTNVEERSDLPLLAPLRTDDPRGFGGPLALRGRPTLGVHLRRRSSEENYTKGGEAGRAPRVISHTWLAGQRHPGWTANLESSSWTTSAPR
jgi:hypothetical protein